MGQRNRLWDLISKEFKQSLRLGSTLVKKLEELLPHRFCCLNSLSLKMRLFFFPQLREGTCHMREIYFLTLERQRKDSASLLHQLFKSLYFKLIHMPMRHTLGPPTLDPNTHHHSLTREKCSGEEAVATLKI